MNEPALRHPTEPYESNQSPVSWAAVIAGAVTASALAMVLLALGSGIGLSSISPWSNTGISATSFGTLTIAWLVAIQLFSYGVGGYIAGRLRINWVTIHTDEVYFRDTAHGLLVWATGTLLSAFILAHVVTSAVSGAVSLADSAAKGMTSVHPSTLTMAADVTDDVAYFSDMFFRSDTSSQRQADIAPDKAEVGRIFSRSLASGVLNPDDQAQITRLIVRQTGMSQADAGNRVTNIVTEAKAAKQQVVDEAKKAAEVARKIGVHTALWAFISLLIGAFSASYMATVGGRMRNDNPIIKT